MDKKIALFAFNGDPMCFVHVLLNALDMHERGYDIKLVIEGSATTLIETLAAPAAPFGELYEKVKRMKLIDAVCRACASKMGTLNEAQAQGLPMNKELSGHPSMGSYLDQGYEIITF
ncbi:cytoplasmic protein [candidate division KSB3 bacterium]|uniref:Cytoplasmic protein n=1 Tax=candidate division KSB3 bacterium TaxID=2044937 RepID=A0A2G6E5L5_9BACT|nr:MAG: cytoplasmic protein [candidate division KSB3 bacterium]PIE29771.1 MAG: cytoplasmic protein [candidate division KSB3 bacterium]